MYRRLLRIHVLPGFGDRDLDEITPQAVRTWRAARLAATGSTTVAKSYRLLKAIMETATDDELIRRNPCRIKGAGSEQATERSTATVAQVDGLAEAMGPRWRLMVYFCAYGPMRPEEQAALRRTSVALDPLAVRITEAAPELNTGRRVEGDTLSTQSGATLKDTMVRAGQSSEKAAMIYQHSDDDRPQGVADGIHERVRAAREKAGGQPKAMPQLAREA